MNIDTSYKDYIETLKKEITQARIKAHLAVNRELVLLYWKIGNHILEMQKKEGWGAKIIEQVFHDLRKEFPEMRGLSSRNLIYMRTFADRWTDSEITQQLAAQIPWFHNCALLDKVNEQEKRLWYAQKTIENGESRPIPSRKNVFARRSFSSDVAIQLSRVYKGNFELGCFTVNFLPQIIQPT